MNLSCGIATKHYKEKLTKNCLFSFLSFLYKFLTSVTVWYKEIHWIQIMSCFLFQENVSCLNTTIIFLMFAERKGNLPIYLHDLRAEEQEQCRPGFLLQNLRELLLFWQEHYLHKEKDCTALEKVNIWTLLRGLCSDWCAFLFIDKCRNIHNLNSVFCFQQGIKGNDESNSFWCQILFLSCRDPVYVLANGGILYLF